MFFYMGQSQFWYLYWIFDEEDFLSQQCTSWSIIIQQNSGGRGLYRSIHLSGPDCWTLYWLLVPPFTDGRNKGSIEYQHCLEIVKKQNPESLKHELYLQLNFIQFQYWRKDNSSYKLNTLKKSYFCTFTFAIKVKCCNI